MPVNDNNKPLFPKEWGWAKYEPAFREMAAQDACLKQSERSLSESEQWQIWELMEKWYLSQIDAGMPDAFEQAAKGSAFQEIYDRLKCEAAVALEDGTLGQLGMAHWRFAGDRGNPDGCPVRITGCPYADDFVRGRIDGHPDYRFIASVDNPSHLEGINEGRVIVLEIQRDSETVAYYDRGWIIRPQTPEHIAVLSHILDAFPDLNIEREPEAQREPEDLDWEDDYEL